MPEEHPHRVVDRIVREEWGRVLSILVGQLRDFELAEDALQDALVEAMKRWRSDEQGIPENPCAWLLQVAKRKMIDQVRRRENFREKESQILASLDVASTDGHPSLDMKDDAAFPDERLRLIFTCCHPALAEEARVALTLQTLGGLKTSEVARAFLVPEATLAQRLVRAKKKIKAAGIPYEIPRADCLGDRVASVLAVIYLIFNEGYSASSGKQSVRVDLCEEAIRLGRILVLLAPEQTESKGLLALMLLHHSRTRARIDPGGNLVTLEHQDRTQWDRDQIKEGLATLESALADRVPGPYQIQAAISALHAEATDHGGTDWQQIYLLYQSLYTIQATSVVRINAIVALSYAGGPEAAIAALSEIRRDSKMAQYLPFYAAEADLFRRVGDSERARAAYHKAIELAGNAAERAYFARMMRKL